MILFAKEERQEISLFSGFWHRHYFEQVAVRIFEVESAPAAPRVDAAVGGVVRSIAIRQSFRFDAREDAIVVRIADVERVVMTLILGGVITRIPPALGLVGECQGQARIHLHSREKAVADFQAENFGEEFC